MTLPNGDAFRAFTAVSTAYLADWQVIDYYRQPLPSEVDERLAAMVDRLLTAAPAERVRFQQALPAAQRALFGIFGHRAATLAVRQAARDWLLRGLVGTAVANYVIPPRRNVDVSLALFHFCARKLGVNTVDLFDEAAAAAGEAIADHLRAFGRRSDVRLVSYGWRELKTPDGVQYKFEWR